MLSRKSWFDFKALFLAVHENLRERKVAGGGEEMLRLRAYEKLQNLVQQGIVKKEGKKYRGVASGLAAYAAQLAEFKNRVIPPVATATTVS